MRPGQTGDGKVMQLRVCGQTDVLHSRRGNLRACVHVLPWRLESHVHVLPWRLESHVHALPARLESTCADVHTSRCTQKH